MGLGWGLPQSLRRGLPGPTFGIIFLGLLVLINVATRMCYHG